MQLREFFILFISHSASQTSHVLQNTDFALPTPNHALSDRAQASLVSWIQEKSNIGVSAKNIVPHTGAIPGARGLTKRYGHVVALDVTDFDLYPNEVLGVIGDNGARNPPSSRQSPVP
uniref:Uncharacterized protein n=1 Tax=Candidatus Kentrum sp. LFY TaxID=2126342 RepID=A0A450UQ82_9GAMM|nr:MAG: hypothetical protein BECKLFY1418A_GA0070994_104310 [Candidatus Kentron sp. LFY]